MIDFSKLYCPCRSGQLVNNFCNKQQCQVGLCASCICIHTQQHMQKGTSPNYQNIKDSYKQLSNSITEQVQQLDKIKTRIGQVQSRTMQKKNKVRQTIKTAKEQVLEFVKQFYQKKQQEILTQMQACDKKEGLHCQHRLDILRNGLNKQITNLVTALHDLSQKNILQAIPKIKTQNLHNSRTTSSQISSETKQNEQYNASLVYNANIFNELQFILNRSVTLNISKNHAPTPTLQSQNVPQPLRIQQNYQAKPVSQSQQKFYKPTSIPVQQPPPQFTLRRPSSQGNLFAFTDSTNIDMKQSNFINVFNPTPNIVQTTHLTPQKNQNAQSRTSINNKISIQSAKKPQLLNTQISKAGGAPQKTRGSFEMTFGNLPIREVRPSLQLPNHNNLSILTTHSNDLNKVSLSRVSQNVNPTTNDKSFSPWYVSDYQGRQINNNIKKMEKRSNLDRKVKKSGIQILTSFDNQLDQSKDYLKQNLGNYNQERPMIYRTQFF